MSLTIYIHSIATLQTRVNSIHTRTLCILHSWIIKQCLKCESLAQILDEYLHRLRGRTRWYIRVKVFHVQRKKIKQKDKTYGSFSMIE